MTGLARANPAEGTISLDMATMSNLLIGVAIQTGHRHPSLDDIIDRGESGPYIDRPS